MGTTESPSETTAAPATSIGGAARERNFWLLVALGFATGIPAGWTWYGLVLSGMYAELDWTAGPGFTRLTLAVLVGFLVAPFLDRTPAPLFRGLGHRRSWVALGLACALALSAASAIAAALAPAAYPAVLVVAGMAAIPVLGVLWMALDALRIELRPGKAQAPAMMAQLVGALAAAAITINLDIAIASATLRAFALVVPLALGLFLVRFIDEPPPRSSFASAPTEIVATMARSWSDFFGRHRPAGWLLLAAIAFYALGASTADYLGKQGYLIDLLSSGRSDTGSEAQPAARIGPSMQEIVFSLVGAFAGMALAWRFAPASGFMALQFLVVGFIVVFVACRLALGFDVFTVAGLFALRTLLFAAGIVLYSVVAARLTARPHTAAQFALLGLLASVFWLHEAALNRLAPALGSYGTALAGIVAALCAIGCMGLARRRIPPGTGHG